MELIDLEPQWLMYEGRRVGLIFRSPTNKAWWQTCFVETFNLFTGFRPERDPDSYCSPDSQAEIIKASAPHVGTSWQGCDKNSAWTVVGGIEAASFETITISPSLDGSKGGLWHGHIANGQIVGGI